MKEYLSESGIFREDDDVGGSGYKVVILLLYGITKEVSNWKILCLCAVSVVVITMRLDDVSTGICK